jgi:L-lysine 6-transaminase
MSTDGMKLVVDLGPVPEPAGRRPRPPTAAVDMYAFPRLQPTGVNPPQLVDDPSFVAELTRAAINKPATKIPPFAPEWSSG